MKTILFFVTLFLLTVSASAQVFSADDLFSITSYSPSKFDKLLSAKGFAPGERTVRNDTFIRNYDYRRTRNFKDIDSINRLITRTDNKGESFITYETASLIEFWKITAELKHSGFYCNQEADSDHVSSLLFQSKDRCARACTKKIDTVLMYSMEFHRKLFPNPKDIYFADDLLTFTSHEYLVHYFGENNVKKDIYYLSGKDIAKCSVLFLNTDRQVVFIWADEENRCTISSLLFGGQLNLKSSLESGRYIAENNWRLKSGVRPGMSLAQLRMLNGNDFSFYGGKSANSGTVIPEDANGKLDFKKEEITLGCLNCNDDKFAGAKVVHADDSLEEGRILFVLSVTLNHF